VTVGFHPNRNRAAMRVERMVRQGPPSVKAAREDTFVFFHEDEVAMLRFLAICQPSLNPEHYTAVLKACQYLSESRSGLDEKSLDKCLKYLNVQSESNSP
jgi:hypothetical protein